MDTLTPGIQNLQWVLTLGILTLFLLLEWMSPFRVPVQPKWHHVSTNLVIIGANSLVASVLGRWVVLLWSKHVENQQWGLLHYLKLGAVTQIVLSIFLLDLAYYAFHRLNHIVPLLWRFHRAHHSDLDMDVTTSVRFHLGEVLITNGFKAVSVLALGVSPIGFLISETAFLAAGQFQHSNFKMPALLERWVRRVIVTPPMHWIHHSRRSTEHNSNFGVMISGWDRWFGTYFIGVEQKQIELGLEEYPTTEDVNILRFYRIPFDPACRRTP